MSRLPWLFALMLIFVSVGCMHQPMYPQGYGQPMYGQPMYGPGGYSQPGTLVVPPSNGAPQDPGSTYDNPKDDFGANGDSKDPRFFGSDDGKVPDPKDPNPDEPFKRDLINPGGT
jgi:hypothetical protein